MNITILIPEVKYNILLHDLTHIANYLDKTSTFFDESNMLMYKRRLGELRQELIDHTDTKD